MPRTNKGKCALCGIEKKLTFEHIPPRAAFNFTPARPVSGMEMLIDDRLPWDTKNLHFKNSQQGMGKHSLCRACNNNTGSWYAQDYIDLALAIDQYFRDNVAIKHDTIIIDKLHPLRIIKQIASMFCSINNPYDPKFDSLRKFVLNKNQTGLDSTKYKICCYFTKSSVMKYVALSTLLYMKSGIPNVNYISEITAYPLGFLLYLNPDNTSEYKGIDITSFSKFNYDDVSEIHFPICIYEMNDIFPEHFRSKQEIIEYVEYNENFRDNKLT